MSQSNINGFVQIFIPMKIYGPGNYLLTGEKRVERRVTVGGVCVCVSWDCSSVMVGNSGSGTEHDLCRINPVQQLSSGCVMFKFLTTAHTGT